MDSDRQTSKQSALPFRRNILAFLPVLLLLLTQCGTTQQAASLPTPTPAASSPVYLSDQAGVDVYQVPSGTHSWQFHPAPSSAFDGDGKMVVDHETVYFATDNLSSLNAHTGQQNWQVTFDQQASALASSDAAVFVASNDTVYALDTHNGSPLWHQSFLGSAYPIQTLLFHDGLLYVSQGGSISALDPAPGTTRWHFDLASSSGSVTELLPLENGQSILIKSASALDALDEHDGHVLWHQDIQVQALKISDERLYTVFSDLSTSSPDHVLPMSTGATGLMAISARSGKPIWQVNTPIENGLAAIGASAIYWAKGHDLTAWNTANGAQLWHISNTDTYQRLIATDNLAIAETSHGILDALQAANGQSLWRQSNPSHSVMELRLEQGKLCWIDEKGTVIALSLENGSQQWYLMPGNPVSQLVIG
ncbi:MAG TPA: PQQ-binding-like beta-propeller repeat protein [Ktedonosporobacter sp.]|nr:PQQ-binding-like beta-propeller repeat protein [Ktedonosporobacter sp.]